MKKLIWIVICLAAICGNVHSEEELPNYYWGYKDFDFFWNSGSFGIGGDSHSNTLNLDISMTVIDLFLEHEATRIGAEINILKILFQAYGKELTETPQVHFLNLKLYWNPFDFDKMILGPFAGINYITQTTNGSFAWDTVTFSTGLKFVWRTREDYYTKIFFQKVGAEIGYRYDQGINSFYFTVTCDAIIPGILMFFRGSGIFMDLSI
ncbi:hypothetical protein FACS1894147_06780 [Spirochaetia bacterium]|nr:hypothetical protein FACS1894147_06780 [Spirochaetia bacterium]